MFFFNRKDLTKLAYQYRESFKNASPFPHIVIDNFLPQDVAMSIGHEFPDVKQIQWRLAGPGDTKHTHDPNIEKISTSDEETFPPDIRHMMYAFQSGIFLKFLENLTGLVDLNGDPYHYGCGLHSTGNGGRLMLHLDASRHPNQDFHQLINLIYYCTPDWQEDYGGHLELWDREAKACVVRIAPIFNRVVIFYTGKTSFHGHPEPIQCPPELRRNSLALYYYTTKKEQSDLEYTNFVQWKAISERDTPTLSHQVKSIIRSTLPTPITNRLARLFRKYAK